MAGAAGPPRRAGRLLGRFGLTRQVTCCGHRLTRGQSEPGSWTQSPLGYPPPQSPNPATKCSGRMKGSGLVREDRWAGGGCHASGQGMGFPDLPAGVCGPRTGRRTPRGDSPAGTLSPSFCQVMLGRGRPEASQGSSTSSSATAQTTLGSGFTTGEAAKEQGGRGPWGHLQPGGVSEHQRQRLLKGTGASGNLGMEDIGRLSLFSQRIP